MHSHSSACFRKPLLQVRLPDLLYRPFDVLPLRNTSILDELATQTRRAGSSAHRHEYPHRHQLLECLSSRSRQPLKIKMDVQKWITHPHKDSSSASHHANRCTSHLYRCRHRLADLLPEIVMQLFECHLLVSCGPSMDSTDQETYSGVVQSC
jgi:hypothetical protein